ncbi:hypothetical protein SKAU_G00013100 [Synaphobranchus kaupii]|uniref:Uncharacterized protein n=1 Tax=Synaphobranchus kaupii TaxID=118154 RepID=A0A9Q1JDJ1_SYNKA|nr:hypothetical protein SKAU_G00013100 [Synaphobranchus kaupii]
MIADKQGVLFEVEVKSASRQRPKPTESAPFTAGETTSASKAAKSVDTAFRGTRREEGKTEPNGHPCGCSGRETMETDSGLTVNRAKRGQKEEVEALTEEEEGVEEMTNSHRKDRWPRVSPGEQHRAETEALY